MSRPRCRARPQLLKEPGGHRLGYRRADNRRADRTTDHRTDRTTDLDGYVGTADSDTHSDAYPDGVGADDGGVIPRTRADAQPLADA